MSDIPTRIDRVIGLRKYNGHSSLPRNQGFLVGALPDVMVLAVLLFHREMLLARGDGVTAEKENDDDEEGGSEDSGGSEEAVESPSRQRRSPRQGKKRLFKRANSAPAVQSTVSMEAVEAAAAAAEEEEGGGEEGGWEEEEEDADPCVVCCDKSAELAKHGGSKLLARSKTAWGVTKNAWIGF